MRVTCHMTTAMLCEKTYLRLCRSLVESQRMSKFLVHWMVLGILNDHLGLEYFDADGSEQDALPDGEQRSLLKRRVPKRPFPEREHQVVGHSVQEDAHAVGIEGVAGEPLALHALLELAYVQLVLSPLAVGGLVQVTCHDAADVAHDEADVGLPALLRHLHLHHHTLAIAPGASLVGELTELADGMLEQLVVVPHLLRKLPHDGLCHQHAVGRESRDEEDAPLQGARYPVHQLVGAEVAVAPDGDGDLRPCGTNGLDEPLQRVEYVGRLVPAPRLQQREYQTAAVALEYHQRHVAEAVVVGVEDGLLLLAVGVDVRVVAVQDDVARGLAPVGEDEHRDEQLLDGKQLVLRHRVLEAAHRGRGADVLAGAVTIDGELHHGLTAVAVAVVHILVAEADLEDARHDYLLQRVMHEIFAAPVRDAGCQLAGYRQVLFLLSEQGQTAEAGERHAVHVGLHWKINYTLEKNFLRIFLVCN